VEPSSAAGSRWHLPTLRSIVPFPAADIPRPAPEHAVAMLSAEILATQELLAGLDTAAWERPAVRDLVTSMILDMEEVGRNRRLLDPPWQATVTDAYRERRTTALAAEPHARLIADSVHWGHETVLAALGGRRGPARNFQARAPVTLTADYLFRVLLPRQAWLRRADIAEAVDQRPTPGPHGAEIIRQTMRDLALAWSGRPVLIEVTDAPAGLWIVGKGEAVAALRSGPFGFVRQVTQGRDNPSSATTGDATVMTALLATRIPG